MTNYAAVESTRTMLLLLIAECNYALQHKLLFTVWEVYACAAADLK